MTDKFLLEYLGDLERAGGHLNQSWHQYLPIQPTQFRQAIQQWQAYKPALKTRELSSRQREDLKDLWQQVKTSQNWGLLKRGHIRDLLAMADTLQQDGLVLLACLDARQPWPPRLLATVLRAYLDNWQVLHEQRSEWLQCLTPVMQALKSSTQQQHQQWYKYTETVLHTHADYQLAKEFAAGFSPQAGSVADWLAEQLPGLTLSNSRGSLVDGIRRQLLGFIDITTLTVDACLYVLNQLVIVADDGPWLSQLILNVPESCRESVKTWFLKHEQFGDPRLRQIKSWALISDMARQAFIGWLSQEDLEFFFKVVLPPERDPHKRRPFWENYLHLVQGSRVLMTPEEKQKHALLLQKMENDGKTIPGNSIGSDIFIMKIGQYFIVEFSQSGNALYIYKENGDKFNNSRDAKKMIDAAMRYQSIYENKNGLFKEGKAAENKIDHLKGWQDNARKWLTAQGIRPKSNEEE